MASLPFMNSTGLPEQILKAIISAQVPERYTQDFQKTVLGFGSGSARAFIPLLKKLGFLDDAGNPTGRYSQFRTERGRSPAMLAGLKSAYGLVFRRNENAHKLNEQEIRDLVVEITGRSSSDKTVGATVNTFKALNKFVDLAALASQERLELQDAPIPEGTPHGETQEMPSSEVSERKSRKLSNSYTINLNLPPSKDPEVFNAIFDSLKKSLLDG